MKTKKQKTEDIEDETDVEIIGDLDWNQLRNFMITELQNCTNEIQLKEFFNNLLNAIGSPEEIKQRRKELGIKQFSNEDLIKLDRHFKDEN